MSSSCWPRLFSPIRVGTLELPNRILLPAMDPSLADDDGQATDAMVHHYALRASGGAGLLVSGNLGCELAGRAGPNQAMISSDRHIPGLARTVRAVHEQGGRILLQVSHAGRQTLEAWCGRAVSASAIPCPLTRTLPRALEPEEVEELALTFARAASRAQEAGADGVEFHMAHGYLVCQFLSPYSNHRDDEWGRDPQGRVRLAERILLHTRALVGPDFPICCRLSVDERVDGGIKPDLALFYAHRLLDAGATLLSASACNYESFRYNMPAFYLPRATYAPLARGIREGIAGRAPVVAVGRYSRGEEAEASLAAGDADLIAFGRALIADPSLPRLLQEGRDQEVCPCVACNRCVESIARGPLRCTVNPQAGHPPRAQVPALKVKKILIVGAGPAGISAAIEASGRGHEVTLIEASERPGGHAWSAALPPQKEDFARYAAWLCARLENSKVELRLGSSMSPNEVLHQGAEKILIAVGAQPSPPPPIPGLAQHPDVVHPMEAFHDQHPRAHVLIIGAGAEGSELADTIVRRPNRPRVSLVELRRKIGLGLPTSVRLLLEERLVAQGVYLHTGRGVSSISPEGIQLSDPRGNPKETLPPADLIVLATGTRAPIAWSTFEMEPHVTLIGDCKSPATILEAVSEAFWWGRAV